jgi:hypothetical protein
MKKRLVTLALLATGIALAQEVPPAEPPAEPKTSEEAKEVSGMSILGNQEAPKSLVIVPWKSSELGASPGISPLLDDSRQPVDREVFLRALSYHAIRSETKRPDAAVPVAAAPRSKS